MDAVADPQDDRREACREQRSGEDRDLDVLVALAPGAERELPDEEGDGEADAGEQGDADGVDGGVDPEGLGTEPDRRRAAPR